MSRPSISPSDKARTDQKRARLETIGRSVPEWIGASADTPVPDAVKLRVFRRYGGRCYLSGAKIRAGDDWDIEHMVALGLDGSGNRESNLAPALKAPHKVKSAQDVARIAKADRVGRKHFGLAKAKRGGFRGWRNFAGQLVWKDNRG